MNKKIILIAVLIFLFTQACSCSALLGPPGGGQGIADGAAGQVTKCEPGPNADDSTRFWAWVYILEARMAGKDCPDGWIKQ